MAGEDRVTEFEDVGISDGIEWRALRANPGGHQYAELTAKLVDPATTVTREMYLVKSLLSESEIDALRARFEELCASNDAAATAAQPMAHARILVEDGRIVCPELHALLSPALEARILPYVRARLGDGSVVVADALMRAYRHDDRRQALAPHFDVTSYATVIIPLNPGRGEYSGGLYVQPGADATTRVLVDASFDKGDALMHRFDVMHGVEVTGGDRYSLVLWLSQRGVAPEATPWLQAAARAGNVYAQFLYAEARKAGIWGWEADLCEAADFQGRAARQARPPHPDLAVLAASRPIWPDLPRARRGAPGPRALAAPARLHAQERQRRG